MRNMIALLAAGDEAIMRHAPGANKDEFRALFLKLADAAELLARYDAIVLKDLRKDPIPFREFEAFYKKQRELAALLHSLENKSGDQLAVAVAERGLLERVSTLTRDTEKEMHSLLKI
jgi:hypothetical protein